MNVDDVIAERIAAARARAAAAKERRLALAANRQHGLTARHRAKLARLDAAEKGQQDALAPDTADPTDPPAETTGTNPKEIPMTERTLTPGLLTAAADDIRDHGYGIVQTRIERVPARYRSTRCAEPDGCSRPATLVTFALAELVDDGDDEVGYRFERNDDGEIIRIPVCDEHRCEASHDLYHALTGKTRPDGIRAFDVPGQHLNWT